MPTLTESSKTFLGEVFKVIPEGDYGFIRVGEKEYFFHKSFTVAEKMPAVGETVLFNIQRASGPGKRDRAVNVEVVV
jgi:hypothetical protein